MRATLLVLGIALLAGCSGESRFPEPTGKGTFRAINAVSDSPELVFRVEESGGRFSQGFAFPLTYQSVSVSAEIDDFEFAFNFDAAVPGQDEPERIASQQQKIDADQDYTFILTGTAASPSVSTLIAANREFADTDTVFEVRFAHLADSAGRVDVYFAAPGTAPVLGAAQATLGFGEVFDALDFDSGGDFELTVTAENDPAVILFQSTASTFAARSQFVLALFDATADQTAPFTARALGANIATNATIALPDARFPSTVRFVQASPGLSIADVYDDEMLMNRIVADHDYRAITDEIPIATGTTTFTYTAAGNPGVVQLEGAIVAGTGNRYEFFAVGEAGSLSSVFAVTNAQTNGLSPTLSIFDTQRSRRFYSVYLLEPGTSFEDTDPVFSVDNQDNAFPRIPVLPGTYELLVTEFDGSAALTQPLPVTLNDGDVLRFVLFATADPNLLDVAQLP